MLSVTKIFKFEAAHRLPAYDGKCKKLHGHSYRLEIEVTGEKEREGSREGMVLDFFELKTCVEREIIDKVDHETLNIHFDTPTAENMVIWIRDVLIKFLPGLVRIRLWETDTCYAEWRFTG